MTQISMTMRHLDDKVVECKLTLLTCVHALISAASHMDPESILILKEKSVIIIFEAINLSPMSMKTKT